MSENNSETMLTADVARLAEVVPATVRHWETQGKLPAKRTASGVRLFDRRDVEALIASRQKSRS